MIIWPLRSGSIRPQCSVNASGSERTSTHLILKRRALEDHKVESKVETRVKTKVETNVETRVETKIEKTKAKEE